MGLLVVAMVLALVILAACLLVGLVFWPGRRGQHGTREAIRERQQLLDGLPIGVLVVGMDGRTQYANRMSTELLGLGESPETNPHHFDAGYRVMRAGTDDLYPAADVPVHRALAGETVRLDDLEIARDGIRTPIEVWANPIYNRSGKQVAAAAAYLDVTASRQAQREIADWNTELEGRVASRTAELAASNHELEAFSYSVSHDLRAPLRAMAGFAAKIQARTAGQEDAELARYAERIAVNAQKMGTLIDQLLTFSRLNRQDLNKSSFLPADAVRRALDDLSDDVAHSKAEVSVAEMPPAIGDPGLVQEVYLNLLSNALKYSRNRERPVVEIGATPTPGVGTVFYVRDNGAGFDMRFKDKLFGVFQRLHGSDEYEGIGVGLAIVKRIVTRHGGVVFAEGTVDGGATFSFTLGGV